MQKNFWSKGSLLNPQFHSEFEMPLKKLTLVQSTHKKSKSSKYFWFFFSLISVFCHPVKFWKAEASFFSEIIARNLSRFKSSDFIKIFRMLREKDRVKKYKKFFKRKFPFLQKTLILSFSLSIVSLSLTNRFFERKNLLF